MSGISPGVKVVRLASPRQSPGIRALLGDELVGRPASMAAQSDARHGREAPAPQ